MRYDTGSGETVSFNQSNGLGSTRIRVAFELRDGMVAVGTQDGLALIRGDKVVAFYDKDNGLETQSILCIVQAPDGTLLAGSAGSGIYALAQDGPITKFSYEQGLEIHDRWSCVYTFSIFEYRNDNFTKSVFTRLKKRFFPCLYRVK